MPLADDTPKVIEVAVACQPEEELGVKEKEMGEPPVMV
jgi:xanthine dehydrogenase molybdopterin-binding subunit B